MAIESGRTGDGGDGGADGNYWGESGAVVLGGSLYIYKKESE